MYQGRSQGKLAPGIDPHGVAVREYISDFLDTRIKWDIKQTRKLVTSRNLF